MEVNGEVGHGKEYRADVVRNHCRRPTDRIAWKGSVEIATVQRRDTPASLDGGRVQRRQYDDPATDIRRFDLARELRKRDLPLIFIAVVAGDE